jgi:hypothetical protein
LTLLSAYLVLTDRFSSRGFPLWVDGGRSEKAAPGQLRTFKSWVQNPESSHSSAELETINPPVARIE